MAPPAMTEIGTSTPLGDIFFPIDVRSIIELYIYIYMVSEESRLCHHVVNETGCNMGVEESCMRPSDRKVIRYGRASSTKWHT